MLIGCRLDKCQLSNKQNILKTDCVCQADISRNLVYLIISLKFNVTTQIWIHRKCANNKCQMLLMWLVSFCAETNLLIYLSSLNGHGNQEKKEK